MIRILGSIPKSVAVAVSGGPDSMAALDFCIRGGRRVSAIYFNHGTEHGDEAEDFIRKYCDDNNIRLMVGVPHRAKEKSESPEEYWRNIRYHYFTRVTNLPIITAHTLDDQVEQWIFTSLHGNPRLIPYERVETVFENESSKVLNIIRPFILNKKSVLVNWCYRKNVPYVIDPSNFDSKYMRSLIRNEIVPNALRVNPGLHKVIAKKIRAEWVGD